MATINPCLNFKGTTEEAFNFYKTVFGTEFIALQRFGGAPGCDGMPAEDENKIMHISLPIGKDNVLMGTDVTDANKFDLIVGNNFSMSLNTDTEAEATTLFTALSEGAEIRMPLQKTFWGAYFGMLVDKFGIQWMVNYDYEQE